MAGLVAPLPLLAAGTLASAAGTLMGGATAQAAADAEAAQMRQAAGQSRATAQQEAIQERRRAELAQSRALALAAASGGGASDPTVVNTVGALEREGEYNALSALYEGEERARGLDLGARMRRFEGASNRRGSYFSAGTNLLMGGGSLLEKYSRRDGSK